MASLRTVVAGTLLVLCSIPQPARAFDYPEHQYLAYLGLRLFHREQCQLPAAGCQDAEALLRDTMSILQTGNRQPCEDPSRCSIEWRFRPRDPRSDFVCTAADFLPRIVPMGPSGTCGLLSPSYAEDVAQPAYSLFGRARACVNLADLPALSGDHASSPMTLMWRWFNPALRWRRQQPPLSGALTTIMGDSGLDEHADRAILKRPDVSGFFGYVRGLQADRWPLGFIPGLADLSVYDDAMFGLKDRSASHFRPPFARATIDSIAERSVLAEGPPVKHLPARHAFAQYADMHLGAMHFARLARDQAGHPEIVRRLLGVAGVLELSAWHYLQDGMAPGHMLVDARRYTTGSAATGHDAANTVGLVFAFPNALCERYPGLLAPCNGPKPRQETLTIYGDGALETCVPGWANTADWGAALEAISLAEVLDAYRGALTSVSTDEQNVYLNPGFGEPKASCLQDRARELSCIGDWWHATTTPSARARYLRWAWSHHDGYFQALRFLPHPDATSFTYDHEVTNLARGTYTGRGLALGARLHVDPSRPEMVLPTANVGFATVQSFVGALPQELRLDVELRYAALRRSRRLAAELVVPWRIPGSDVLAGPTFAVGADAFDVSSRHIVGDVGLNLGVVLSDPTDFRLTLFVDGRWEFRNGEDAAVFGVGLEVILRTSSPDYR